MSGAETYAKKWLSIEAQLSLMESRGLKVSDRNSALQFLKHVNYYRFSGYCLAYQKSDSGFENVDFSDIQIAYQFDVVLRDILTEALEVIEVDVRSNVALIFGERYGAFGHTLVSNFRTTFAFFDWTVKIHEETGRSSELFVKHFEAHYEGYPNLPCWVVTEIMSFGLLSRMYSGLLDQCQSPIANRYSLQKGDLESALHHLSYVRNVCAHHCRLWDRKWDIAPKLPHNQYWQPPLVPQRDRLFVTLLLIYRILKRCPSQNLFAIDWRRRINELLRTPPTAPNALSHMGMPPKWHDHPYWK